MLYMLLNLSLLPDSENFGAWLVSFLRNGSSVSYLPGPGPIGFCSALFKCIVTGFADLSVDKLLRMSLVT